MLGKMLNFLKFYWPFRVFYTLGFEEGYGKGIRVMIVRGKSMSEEENEILRKIVGESGAGFAWLNYPSKVRAKLFTLPDSPLSEEE
jgi:hypothetical protein